MLSNSKKSFKIWVVHIYKIAGNGLEYQCHGHKRSPTITEQHDIIKDYVTMMSKNTDNLTTVHPILSQSMA